MLAATAGTCKRMEREVSYLDIASPHETSAAWSRSLHCACHTQELAMLAGLRSVMMHAMLKRHMLWKCWHKISYRNYPQGISHYTFLQPGSQRYTPHMRNRHAPGPHFDQCQGARRQVPAIILPKHTLTIYGVRGPNELPPETVSCLHARA